MDPFDALIGQDAAVAQLRAAAGSPVHAYLLVGPPGTGKRAAAMAFATALVCASGGCGDCAVCHRVAAGSHPDVAEFERVGPYITVRQAEEIGRLAALSPAEASRRVLVLHDFHLVEDAAPALLKAIEEPRTGTVFVVLASHISPELRTIASRCVQIPFAPLGEERIASVLVDEGVEAGMAEEVALLAGGSLDRARLLAADPEAGRRHAAWTSVPARLDGSGATAATVADELLELIRTAGAGALAARQAAEVAAWDERASVTGERGGRKDLDDRHRREQRRLRTDELRAGLAALEGALRARAVSAPGDVPASSDVARALAGAAVVQAAAKALEHNPNESLLLQALMVRLTPR